jgi:hypothetical protein
MKVPTLGGVMKLNMNTAQEFARILEQPNFKPQSMDNMGNFVFGFKGAEQESEILVDSGIIASLLQLKQSVDRGQSAEETLKKQIQSIKSELKI